MVHALPAGAHHPQPRVGGDGAAHGGRTGGWHRHAAGRLRAHHVALAKDGTHHDSDVSRALPRRLPDGAHLSLRTGTDSGGHVAQPRHDQLGRGGRTAVTATPCHRVGGGYICAHHCARRHAVGEEAMGQRGHGQGAAPACPLCHGRSVAVHSAALGAYPLLAHQRHVSAERYLQPRHGVRPADGVGGI